MNSRLSRLLALSALVALTAPAAKALDGTWTANANSNWGTAASWSGSTIADGAGFTANFTSNITAARTVTLEAVRTIGNIVFTDSTTSSHDLTITALTLTLDASGSPNINVTQSDRSLSIGSIIAGNDGLQKSGPGQLRLTAANTFTGAINVTAGNLTIVNYAALDLNTDLITVSGGTAGFQVAQVGTGTTADSYSQNLSLHGFLRAIGGNTTNIGNFTWNGNITLAGNSTITNNGNTTFDINGTIDLGSHTLTYQADRNGSRLDGIISGSGGLTKTSVQNLTLSAANTYTGATNISDGTLILNNATALGGNNPGVNGTISISMGANTTLQSNYVILDAGNVDSFVYAPITLTAAGTNNFFIGNGSSSAPAEAVTFNLNGAIGGTAGSNVVFGNTTASRNNADSIIVLGAASTYNGNTTIQAGNTANRINVIAGVPDALPTTTVLGFDATAGSGSGRTTQFDLNGNNQTLAGLNNGGTVASLRNIRVTNSGALAMLTINGASNSTFGGVNGSQSAQITGAIALTKDGAGTFTLAAGAGNAFTGATKILGGILSLGHTTSIQNSAFDTLNSITGDLTNGLQTTVTTLTLGGLTGNKNFADVFTTSAGGYAGLTNLTLNPGTGVTNSYSADVGNGNGSMTLTKTGAGNQVLFGTQSYSSGSIVNAGGLVFGDTNAKPASGTHAFVAGTTLGLGVATAGSFFTSTDIANAFAGTMTGNLSNVTVTTTTNVGIDTTAGNFTYGDVLGSPTKGLTKFGPNDLALNGTSYTYTGPTTVIAGTLTLSNPLALQNSALVTTGAGTVILGSGTSLTLGGLSGATGNLATVISSYSTITALILNVPAGVTVNYGGNITDGFAGMTVTKTGQGTQALSGTNSYTGGTTVTTGVLVFRNTNAKSSTGTHAFAAGTTLGLGVATTGSFYTSTDIDNAFAGTMTGNLSGITITGTTNVGIDTTVANFAYATSVPNVSNGLTKLGLNTLTLSGNSAYTGLTAVNAGTLALDAVALANLSASTTVTVASGAQLRFTATASSSPDFNFNSFGLNLTGQGADNVTTHRTVYFGDNNSNIYNLPGNVAVANGVQFYTFGIGNVINFGGQFSGTGDMSFVADGNGGHTFNFTGDSSTTGYAGKLIFYATSGVGPTTVTAKLSVGNNRLPTTASVQLEPFATNSVAANLDLNGNNQEIAGLTTSAIGALAAKAIVLNSGAGTPILTINNASANSFSGVLGTGGTSFALTKSGSGTLTLTGANTYSGGTIITAGTLAADTASPDSATGTSAVSVNAGTLRGVGNITGAVTLSGGTIAPGDANNTGVLTLSNGFMPILLTGGMSFNLTDGNINSSQLNITATGTLALGTALILSVTPFNGAIDPAQFTLIASNGNSVTGNFVNNLAVPINDGDLVFTNSLTGTQYFIDYGPTGQLGNVVLTAVPVPEPMLLGIVGVAMLMGFRRRLVPETK